MLGSETHFTVLFSLDQRLVAPPSPRDEAKYIFERFDEASNGFIAVRLQGGVERRLTFSTKHPLLPPLQAEKLEAFLDAMPQEFDNSQREALRRQLVSDGIVLWHTVSALLYPTVGLFRDFSQGAESLPSAVAWLHLLS